MAHESDLSFDLIVIGGGTAGLAGVMEALDIGVERIALIEREKIGGECAYNACVPTKILLTAAEHAKRIQDLAPKYGVHTGPLTINYSVLKQKVEAVIHQGGYPFLEDPRVRLFPGSASFISNHDVRVNGLVLTGEKILIATGSRPHIPPIEGLVEVNYITYKKGTHLDKLPKSMIILGGGAVSVEFAHLYENLGCHVTILEKEARLLPWEDAEISASVQRTLELEGVSVRTSCHIARVAERQGIKYVEFTQDGGFETIHAEQLLIATGMRPYFEDLEPDAAGLGYNRDGIVVNDEMRTTAENIWAVGDVASPYMFTHVGDHQAVIAVRNAFLDAHQKVDYHALPWAIFTDPPMGRVGLTEFQARERFTQVMILRATAEQVSRYRIISRTDGFIKIVVDGETDRLLGAHMYGDTADEVIQILALAIQKRMTVQDMLELVFIYPTRAQLIQKALEKYTAVKSTKRKKAVINRAG